MPEGVQVDDVDDGGRSSAMKKKKVEQRGSTEIPEDGSLSAQRLMEQ